MDGVLGGMSKLTTVADLAMRGQSASEVKRSAVDSAWLSRGGECLAEGTTGCFETIKHLRLGIRKTSCRSDRRDGVAESGVILTKSSIHASDGFPHTWLAMLVSQLNIVGPALASLHTSPEAGRTLSIGMGSIVRG